MELGSFFLRSYVTALGTVRHHPWDFCKDSEGLWRVATAAKL